MGGGDWGTAWAVLEVGVLLGLQEEAGPPGSVRSKKELRVGVPDGSRGRPQQRRRQAPRLEEAAGAGGVAGGVGVARAVRGGGGRRCHGSQVSRDDLGW